MRVCPIRSIGFCLDKLSHVSDALFPSQNVQHRCEPIDLVLFQDHFIFPERIQQIVVALGQVLRGDELGVVENDVGIVVGRGPIFLFFEVPRVKTVLVARRIRLKDLLFFKRVEIKRRRLHHVDQGFFCARLLQDFGE